MLIKPNAAEYKPFKRYPFRDFVNLMGPHVVEYTKGDVMRFMRENRLNKFYERAKEYGVTVVAIQERIRCKHLDAKLVKVVDFDNSEVGALRLMEFRREFGTRGEDVRDPVV